ncbi:MAG: hypothetical protein WED09_08405 [Homoserinimonas sp.]
MANRHTFLRSEIETLDTRIAEHPAELRQLDEQRDALLRTLDEGGALEELNAMRSGLADVQARTTAVDLQIEQARPLVSRREELELEQSTKRNDATRDPRADGIARQARPRQ